MRRDTEFAASQIALQGFEPLASAPTLGRLLAAAAATTPRVVFDGAPEDGVPARSCVLLGEADVGKEVVLLFAGNDLRCPLIMGVLQALPCRSEVPPVVSHEQPDELRLSAQKQLVLQCGESSITLTQAGKVLIKGSYVLSSSSGTNRLRGGSVEIN